MDFCRRSFRSCLKSSGLRTSQLCWWFHDCGMSHWQFRQEMSSMCGLNCCMQQAHQIPEQVSASTGSASRIRSSLMANLCMHPEAWAAPMSDHIIVQVRTHACMHAHTYVRTYVCMCAPVCVCALCMYVFTYVRMRGCMHTGMHE